MILTSLLFLWWSHNCSIFITMLRLKWDSFVCCIVLLTLGIFYEPARTTTKLPLVGWLKFLNWIELKHTCTLPMWLWMKWRGKLVHGCMVYTVLATRRQQFHVVPAVQQPNSTLSTPLQWILKYTLLKDTVTHSGLHVTWVQWVCSRAEKSLYIKAMNNNSLI